MSKLKVGTSDLAELAVRKEAQLGALLSHLSPEIALQLATALERDRLAGGRGLPFDAILNGLRPKLRQLAPEARRRIPTPQRLFFEVIDGLIVDGYSDKTAGRIARRSLDPIWRWLTAAEGNRLSSLCERLSQQVLVGDMDGAHEAQKQIDAVAGEAIRAAVKKVEQGGKGAKELLQALGGQRAFEDMRELGRVLQVSEEIRALKLALPAIIDRDEPEQFDLIRGAFERSVERSVAGAPYLVLALSSRAAHPWELFGIAAKLVRAEHDQQLKASELAMIGEWLVQGLETEAAALKAIKPADFDPARAEEGLRRFAVLQTGMTREVGMRKDGAWGKRLLKTRGLISDAVEGLFERSVKELQIALPMERLSSGSRSGALVPAFQEPPAPEIADRLPALTKFVAAGKQFAGQLGFSVALDKTLVEIQSLFDDYTDGLIGRLAQSRGPEREVAQAWADLTARVMTPIFSEEAIRILSRRMAAATTAETEARV